MTVGKNPKVLVADDSEILNNLLKDHFEEHGFDVFQAFDGYQCKTLYLKETPDITLLDLQMPGPPGMDVLGFIKRKNPDGLVVVMSSEVSEEIAVESMKLGASEYLKKPFKFEDVVTLSGDLLVQQRSEMETKRLKKQIREGERHLAYITRNINEAIITTDPLGRIEFVNKAATDMWGYSQEELLGKDIHFLIRGEARTRLYRDIVKDTVRLGRIEGDFNFRKKDKGTFPGYLSTSVNKEGGRVRGIVVVVADLTRLYEAERRLKQSEKLASLGRVVEGIAHEVRNCLTSLGGFTRRVRKITDDNADCQRFTGIILEDVARLEQMVRDIEDYVRFSKFYSFTFTDVDIGRVVEAAHKRAVEELPPASVKAVTYNVRQEKGLPLISADPAALEEIFYNLMLNAYEAMPSGGKLGVAIKKLNSAISILISDTGVGMRKEELPEIFNPFVTSKTTGAGMGLSKVYLLVEEHQGSVSVSSELGRGTTFEVFLPVERLMTGLRLWEAGPKDGGPGRLKP